MHFVQANHPLIDLVAYDRFVVAERPFKIAVLDDLDPWLAGEVLLFAQDDPPDSCCCMNLA